MRELVSVVQARMRECYARAQKGRLQRGRDIEYAKVLAYAQVLEDITGVPDQIFIKSLEEGD